MNKKIIIIFIPLLIAGLTACSSDNDSSQKEKHQSLSLPNQVFVSKKSNSKISKSEAKESIKKYLDTYEVLDNNAEKLRYKDGLNSKEREKLNKIVQISNENDRNFHTFIQTNELPETYKKESVKISKYVTSINKLLNKINDKVQVIADKSASDDISYHDIEEIEKINFKYKKTVNGKEQKEIEKFLKQHNIKTEAFNKNN